MTPVQKMRRWRNEPAFFVADQFGVVPDLWQQDALAAIATRDAPRFRLALKACAGPGKLQPKSLLFDTPQGRRSFGSLKIGDEVFAEDGSVTRVTGTHDNGVVQIYRVTFDDGTSTLAGGEHLWKAQNRNDRLKKRWGVVTTNQILARGVREKAKNNKRAWNLPAQGPAEFPRAEFPIDPYLLGVWIGDGTAEKSQFSKYDTEIDAELRLRGIEHERRGMDVFVPKLVVGLRELGLYGKRSHERFLPRVGDVEQRTDLLCGLMDTDGEIGADRCLVYSTTSFQLAEDVAWLVRSLGGKCRISKTPKQGRYTKNGQTIDGRLCWRVSMALPFNPFRIARKAERWCEPQMRYLQRWIDKIEPVGNEDSMCIEVDHPSRCYLTNDFIVTHNTAVLAWIGWWFLSCFADPGYHPKGAAISESHDNLKDNLWAEFAHWRNLSPFLTETFAWTKTRIFHKSYPETWFISARTWSKNATPEEQGRALSGLHARYIMVLVDESGSIPLAVLQRGEQALSSCEWGRIIQAGNPTSYDGMLYAACTTLAEQWKVITITGDPDDPKRSPRINLDYAKEQIKLYGRDNPWVMAYILGLFPPSALNTLIGPDDVDAATMRTYQPHQYAFAQKRIGVDVARFGDDETVIFPRQGLVALNPIVLRNADGPTIAARVLAGRLKWESELEFFDATGGWGASAVDAYIQAGQSPQEVQFAGKALDPRFKNKRAEIWWNMAQWVKRGGAIPNIPKLKRALTTTTYTLNNGKIQIEEKDFIKKRLGGFSPDHADALACTFALPEEPKALRSDPSELAHYGVYLDYQDDRGVGRTIHEHDTFA